MYKPQGKVPEVSFPPIGKRMWYDSETLHAEEPGLPPYFTRINSLNKNKPNFHPLFPDPTEVPAEPSGASAVRVRDSGLKYLAWQFEHIKDFSVMSDVKVPPTLRGLYAFESDADIQVITSKITLFPLNWLYNSPYVFTGFTA